jgi:hypothetical protein
MVEKHHGDAALLANLSEHKLVPFTSTDLVCPLFTALDNSRERLLLDNHRYITLSDA